MADVTSAFGQRLRAEREATEPRLSQRALGMKLNPQVTGQAVAAWEDGTTVPGPSMVFLLERCLELEPGSLSRYLGYLPVGAEPPADVVAALRADPRLDDDRRELMVTTYRLAVRQSRRASE